jgi:N-acetyl-anhydromuramyl-L-alanine amidase AmpD
MSWKFKGRIITEQEARAMIAKGVRGVDAPWRAVGYHAGVELVGDKYQVMPGRAWDATAAAVKEANMNRLGIHICMVGDFDTIAVPAEQWRVTIDLIARVAEDHDIATDRIFGHRTFAPYKSCPGLTVDLNSVRRDVAIARAKLGA